MKNMRTRSGLVFCMLCTVSLMAFMGGCISNQELGYCDAKPIFPGLTWSARRAEGYAHYHIDEYNVGVLLDAETGSRGYGERRAHRYYEPNRSGW